MTLVNVPVPMVRGEHPPIIGEILKAAKWHELHVRGRSSSNRGFVPSCPATVYEALNAIERESLAPGSTFCEWGSGLGIATLLAAAIGFKAYGIEIDRDLHDCSRELAVRLELQAEFIHGSFVPQGAERLVDRAYASCEGELSLDTEADDAYKDLGMEVCDFDIVFAYPWPNDEALTAAIFDKFAAVGALLLTFADPDRIRLRRKER